VLGATRLGRLIANLVKHQDEAGAVSDAGVEPSILLQGGESLEEFGVDGHILHTPGHTDGSVSVLLDEGPALVGDLIQSKLLSRGTPVPSVFAVDRDQMLASIHSVIAHEPNPVYASHAAPFGLEQMRAAFA
jgi:glyoxylase-like metal-dependent hydrolase (beta-lactamase superfamily II)